MILRLFRWRKTLPPKIRICRIVQKIQYELKTLLCYFFGSIGHIYSYCQKLKKGEEKRDSRWLSSKSMSGLPLPKDPNQSLINPAQTNKIKKDPNVNYSEYMAFF